MEAFAMIWDVRVFSIFKNKSVLLQKNICMLTIEYFPVLKHCILIGLFEMVENFFTAILGGGLTSFSLIENPYNKIY